MDRKKGTKKEGMTKEEILTKLKKFEGKETFSKEFDKDYIKKLAQVIEREKLNSKMDYLKKILEKEGLLNQKTKESVYAALGELNEKRAREIYSQEGLNRAAQWYRQASQVSGNEVYDNKAEKIYEELERNRKGGKQGILERKLTLIIAIVGLIFGIFFLSNSITGNTIANLSSVTSNRIGAVFILIGMISSFIYFKKAKKKE